MPEAAPGVEAVYQDGGAGHNDAGLEGECVTLEHSNLKDEDGGVSFGIDGPASLAVTTASFHVVGPSKRQQHVHPFLG